MVQYLQENVEISASKIHNTDDLKSKVILVTVAIWLNRLLKRNEQGDYNEHLA